ncbi:MAG: 50S ribosomal protein P1 [archaeon]
MEYIYAALLLHNAKKEITEASVKKILEASGVAVNDAKLKGLIATLKEVNIEEAITKAAMPVAVAAAPVEKAAAKEEKKEEVSEESAAEGLGALFG